MCCRATVLSAGTNSDGDDSLDRNNDGALRVFIIVYSSFSPHKTYTLNRALFRPHVRL